MIFGLLVLLLSVVEQRVVAGGLAHCRVEDFFLDLRVDLERGADAPSEHLTVGGGCAELVERLVLDEQFLDQLVVAVQKINRVFIGKWAWHGMLLGRAAAWASARAVGSKRWQSACPSR